MSPIVNIIPDNSNVVLDSNVSPLEGTTEIPTIRPRYPLTSPRYPSGRYLPVPLRVRRDLVFAPPNDLFFSTPNRSQTKRERKRISKQSNKQRKRMGRLSPTPLQYQDIETIPTSFSNPSPRSLAGDILPMKDVTESSVQGFTFSPLMIGIAAVAIFLFMRR